MAIPEGYQFLAKLGIVYKEDYDERVTYNQYDAVYYNGSTYIALVDSPVGPPTADGVNWQYMAQGFLSQVISSLTATDKNGVIGEAGATVNAQELINGMSDDIKDKLDKTGDSSDTTVAFEQADERTNIISGESHKTILGKIKKWFTDLTAAAFAQMISSYSDLMANTVSGYLVDALAVKEGFDTVNSNLNESLYHIGDVLTFNNVMIPALTSTNGLWIPLYLDKRIGEDVTGATIGIEAMHVYVQGQLYTNNKLASTSYLNLNWGIDRHEVLFNPVFTTALSNYKSNYPCFAQFSGTITLT